MAVGGEVLSLHLAQARRLVLIAPMVCGLDDVETTFDRNWNTAHRGPQRALRRRALHIVHRNLDRLVSFYAPKHRSLTNLPPTVPTLERIEGHEKCNLLRLACGYRLKPKRC